MKERNDFDGFSVVKDETTSKFGLVNQDNELVVPCEMDEITTWLPDIYEEGAMELIDCYYEMGFLLCRKESKYGIIIPCLSKLIQPKYFRVALVRDYDEESHCNEYLRVDYYMGMNQYGYLDENGEEVPCSYEESAFCYASQHRELLEETFDSRDDWQ